MLDLNDPLGLLGQQEPPRDLTEDEQRFLHNFAANGAAGRRILCFLAHCLVALGMIGAAVAGIIAGAVTLFHLHTGN